MLLITVNTFVELTNRRRKKRTKKNFVSLPWFGGKLRIGGGCLIGGVIFVVLYLFAFYYFFISGTGLRWRGLYGDTRYPDGYEIQGVDISHYQGKINWKSLRSAQANKSPLRFVIIKATEGSTKVDNKFDRNFKQSRENGFIRGAYHFWSNTSSAQSQARFFIKKVCLEKGDLPPVLDVETAPKDVDIADFQSKIISWLTIVENAYGCKPILYTNHKFREKYLSDPIFDLYPYWIAHYYVDELAYKGDWKFWQYTDVGQLPGIKGYVDMNVYNGSFYDLQQLCLK